MPEVRHGQLWPARSQSYKLLPDLSRNEQKGMFDALPAGRALKIVYNDELEICSLVRGFMQNSILRKSMSHHSQPYGPKKI